MTTPFAAALRAELMAATRRPPRRRPTRVAVGAALGAITVAAGALVLSPGPASADVEVTHENGRVIVRLTDQKNSPQAIEAATDKEGLDIEVLPVPSGPSNVGRFVGTRADESDLVDVERLDTHGVTFMAFSLPEDWSGTLTLLLGQTAAPGEAYHAFSDAYQAREPLACSGTLGGPLHAVEPILGGFDVSVQVFTDGVSTEPVPLSIALARHGDDPITGAVAMSSTDVLIDVGRSQPAQAEPTC